MIGHLARIMKLRYPDAKPFDDRQDWTWDPKEAAIPGTYALTVGAATEGASMSHFKAVKDVPGVSARVIHFPGPPRAFLSGWDEATKSSVVVSLPLFREEA